MSHNAMYETHREMLRRCYDSRRLKDYKDYGGRGIKVCKRWHSFKNFVKDMGERPTPKKHTLDRKNTNGNYTPKNCRWATRLEQGRNRRNNRLITANGKTQTQAAWSVELGVSERTLNNRRLLGWTDAEIITTPVRRSESRLTGVVQS